MESKFSKHTWKNIKENSIYLEIWFDRSNKEISKLQRRNERQRDYTSWYELIRNYGICDSRGQKENGIIKLGTIKLREVDWFLF